MLVRYVNECFSSCILPTTHNGIIQEAFKLMVGVVKVCQKHHQHP